MIKYFTMNEFFSEREKCIFCSQVMRKSIVTFSNSNSTTDKFEDFIDNKFTLNVGANKYEIIYDPQFDLLKVSSNTNALETFKWRFQAANPRALLTCTNIDCSTYFVTTVPLKIKDMNNYSASLEALSIEVEGLMIKNHVISNKFSFDSIDPKTQAHNKETDVKMDLGYIDFNIPLEKLLNKIRTRINFS